MRSKHLFQEGLLYLAHSGSSVDGVNHIAEKQAIKRIIEHEKIPEDLHLEVDRTSKIGPEKENHITQNCAAALLGEVTPIPQSDTLDG